MHLRRVYSNKNSACFEGISCFLTTPFWAGNHCRIPNFNWWSIFLISMFTLNPITVKRGKFTVCVLFFPSGLSYMSRSGVKAGRIRAYIESMRRGHMGKWDPCPWSTNLRMPSEWPGMDTTQSSSEAWGFKTPCDLLYCTLYVSSPIWPCVHREKVPGLTVH